MPRAQRHKECPFCRRKVVDIDYKDGLVLGRYTTSWGKIKASSDTGVCSKHQRRLSDAIKRARFLAILPYVNR